MSARTDLGPASAGRPRAERRARRHHPEGKIAIDDFRGQKPVLVGLFRGLHCPFCRRHIAAQARLDPELREKGVESLTVVNTPIERARLYFRYHPMPNLLAAADPERASHRAFGLPNLEFTENETAWPHKIAMAAVMEHAGRPARRTARADGPDGRGRIPRQEGRLRNDRGRPADDRRPAMGSWSASSCSTGKASSAGASPRFRKAGATCSARRARRN